LSNRNIGHEMFPFQSSGPSAFRTISFPEAAILLVSDGDRDLWPGATDSGSLWGYVSHSSQLRRTRSTRLVAGLDVERHFNYSMTFEVPFTAI